MTTLQARYATPSEIDRWDKLVAANPFGGDFVQARAFADTKSAVGWIPRYLIFEHGDCVISVSLVLERRVPLLGTHWYLPHGPAVTDWSAAEEHVAALREFIMLHEPRVFSCTVEPPIVASDTDPEALRAAIAAFARIGAQHREGIQGNTSTAIVNIDRGDEELIASFHKKCRNMITRAQRDGVEIREYPATPETFAHMHRLMRLVGGGKAELRLRSEDYTERFWRGFSDAGEGTFYGIDVDGTPAVMAYMIRIGENAFYKDGGSERPRTSPGMSNLMQWHMMRAARDAGAKSYDMIGVPPREKLDDATHPNHSLAPFKLSFAREVTEYAGAFDIVLRPGAFARWERFGLPIVQRLHRRRYNDLGFY